MKSKTSKKKKKPTTKNVHGGKATKTRQSRFHLNWSEGQQEFGRQTKWETIFKTDWKDVGKHGCVKEHGMTEDENVVCENEGI